MPMPHIDVEFSMTATGISNLFPRMIDHATHVYVHKQCRVQVLSLILDSSVGLSAGIQSADE